MRFESSPILHLVSVYSDDEKLLVSFICEYDCMKAGMEMRHVQNVQSLSQNVNRQSTLLLRVFQNI